MAHAVEDTDDYSDGNTSDAAPDLGYALGPSQTSKIITISIRANYSRWEPREAFRELVQNWRDAIITSYRLRESEFCVLREEGKSGNNNVITYKVQPSFGCRGEEDCFGFIRFTYDRDGKGKVEITNRTSVLDPNHLDIGSSSKAGDKTQAGVHGEGLKIALVVLMRFPQNHSVRCCSGNVNWYFQFNKRGKLAVSLRRVTEKQAEKKRPSSPFKVSPIKDVEFVIGDATKKNYNKEGVKCVQEPVKLSEFNAWTKAALFLQNCTSEAIISTPSGDLLVDPALCGKIYLKGLLLRESEEGRSASVTNRPLKFGYNFLQGATNRERQSLASAKEESKRMLAILSDALTIKSDMVHELSEMLNTAETQYADIAGASRYIKFETASRLKQYLCQGPFSNRWYYSEEDKAENPRLDQIIQGLRREGAALTKTYWGVLKDHGLFRTAEEEERRRFMTAPFVEVENDSFAISVRRLFHACMRACPNTSEMTIRFVQAGVLDLQVFFSNSEQLFRIHERWLSAEKAVEALGLDNNLEETDLVSNIVTVLFTEALEQLPDNSFQSDDRKRSVQWRRKVQLSRARQRLLAHGRMESFAIDTTAGDGKLGVRWDVNSCSNLEIEVEIQCHRAAQCFNLRDKLLVAADLSSDKLGCISHGSRCRSSRISYRAGQHHEVNLEPGEEYFFVFANFNDPASFVSLSSIAKALDQAPALSTSQSFQPAAGHSPTTLHVRHERLSPVPTQSETQTSDIDDHSPLMNGIVPSPGRASTPPESEQAAADGTPPLPEGSFALGQRLDALNILDIEEWYEGRSSGPARAVVGILHEGRALPEGTRKRRRVGT